jgi:hypothetical protein
MLVRPPPNVLPECGIEATRPEDVIPEEAEAQPGLVVADLMQIRVRHLVRPRHKRQLVTGAGILEISVGCAPMGWDIRVLLLPVVVVHEGVEAFIHPGVQPLVAAHQHGKPGVAELVIGHSI